MSQDNNGLLLEIREMLSKLMSQQEKLLNSVEEMKEEQKKLHAEIRMNNFVLSGMNVRNEIIN